MNYSSPDHNSTPRAAELEYLRAELASATEQIRILGEIVHGMSEACFSLDRDWKFTFVNDRCQTLLRHSPDQMIGHSIWDVFQKLVGTPMERNYRRAMAERVPVAFEAYSPIAERWLDIRLFPTGAGLGAFLLDIDSRKKAESEARDTTEKLRTNEAILRETGRIAKVGGWAFDPHTLRGTWTEEAGRIHELDPGVEPNVELGLSFYTPPSRDIIAAAVRDAIEIGKPYDLELEITTARGNHKWVRTIGNPEMDGDRVKVVRGSFQDITDRKLAELALQTSQSRLGGIIASAMDAIIAIDARQTITLFNTAAEKMFGVTSAEALGSPVDRFIPLRFRGPHAHHVRAFGETKVSKRAMNQLGAVFGLRADGREFPVEASISQIDVNGEKLFTVILRDITERKEAEAEILRTSERFRQVVENIDEVFWMTDVEKNAMIYISPGYEKIWGRTVLSLYESPRTWLDALHPLDRVRVGEAAARQASGIYDIEYRIVRPDGAVRWIHDRAVAVRNEFGHVYRIVGVASDITERVIAKETLRAREIELGEAQRVAQIGSWEADIATGRAIWSDEQFRILGLEPQSRSLDFDEYLARLHPDDRDKLKTIAYDAVVRREPFQLDYRIIRDDGRVRWIAGLGEAILDEAGVPVRMRGTNQDITDRKLAEAELTGAYQDLKNEVIERTKVEEQLRHAQKMEAFGQLAGGVAHDFNNLLTVILGHIAILELCSISGDALESFQEIKGAAERAANLIRQLLMFARRQTIQMRPIDLNETIQETARMLRRILGEDIHLEFRPCAVELIVEADAGMLNQVLMNLAVNSRDAMPRGGRLLIETTPVRFDQETAEQYPHIRAGTFACFSVTDSGTGISPEVLPKIFDPFFTTKDVGKGTGLGLATVFGILQQHGGWITAYSGAGLGTTFRIYLPLVPDRSGTAGPGPGPVTVSGGTETILLVEDETAIREMVSGYLARLGYSVLTAGNGAEAIDLFHEHASVIRLVLTDIVMPGGMSGVDLAAILRAEKPDIQVIYTSGYSDTHSLGDLSLREGKNFLAKPFALPNVAAIVRFQLDAVTSK